MKFGEMKLKVKMKINKITTEQMELLVYEYFEKSSLVVVPRFDSMNGCYYEDDTSIFKRKYVRIVDHECDILSVSKKMFLREIEIKVSVSDFKADFKKKHNHSGNIKNFYYAVPYYILDKIKDLVPENAGILVADIYKKRNRDNEIISEKWILKKIKSPKNNNLANPIDEKQLNVIFRIGYLKYWYHRKRKEEDKIIIKKEKKTVEKKENPFTKQGYNTEEFGMEKSSSFYISKRSNKNLVAIKVTNDNVEDVILFCGIKYKTDVNKKKKELLVKGYFELDLIDKDDKIYLGNYITREVSLISGKIWFTLYNEEDFKKIIEN